MQVLSTQGERTNDIARSVQSGDTDILVLWLACRRLVMQTARRWHRAFNGSRGVVLDDLEQVGFLALTKAAETWNPDSGAFSTWLTFQLKTAFAAAYFMRTERDRKDPLNDAVSLDTPPTGTDEDVMLRDIIPNASLFPPEIADIISGIIIYLCAFSLLFKNLIVTLFTGKHKKQAAKAPDAEKPNGKEAQ